MEYYYELWQTQFHHFYRIWLLWFRGTYRLLFISGLELKGFDVDVGVDLFF
jgi:hypothetical protein